MTAAQVLYAESASDVTASTTSWVDVCSIADTSFTAGKKYLILAIAYLRCGSATNDARIRLVHGTTPTAFTDASGSYELTANTQRTCVGFMCTFTQPGTAELVKLQISNASTSTTTCDMGQIIVIKLDDDFTENTDYYFNEVTADYTTTTSFAAQAAVTFTPNGTDDWLIIAQAAVVPGSVTDPYRMSLHDTVEGLDEPSLELEGEDTTNEVREHLIMRVYTPSNASHTFSARFNHTTVASTVLSSRIFAINLSKFSQHAFAYTAAEDAPSASPTWETEQTVSITPSATGDFVILGYYTMDVGATGDNLGSRLQVNNGGGLSSDPNYGDDAPTTDGWDSSDQTPFEIGKVRSLSTGGSRTINLDVRTVTGTAVRVQERTLVVFSVELAASNVSVTPAAATCVAAVVTPTVVLGSLSLAPSAATCVVAIVAPTVVLGAISVAPNPATCVATVIGPTVVLGALTLAPSAASVVGTVVDPTIVLGALTLAPNAATCVATVVDPTVSAGGNVDVTPTPVFCVATVVDPTVVLGALTLAPSAASVVGTVVDPTIVLGALTLAPNAASAIGATVAPAVVLSSMSIAPNPAACVVTVVDPTVVLGALTITPTATSVMGGVVAPTVVLGSMIVAPGAVTVVVGVLDPTVVGGVIWPTPLDRVIVVPIDDRRIEVERESRVLAMAADDRTHEVN